MTDEKLRLLRREITHLNETLHRKNVMLDALHYVWCDGGCGGGVHRYGQHGEIAEEIVLSAESNTKRLRRWWRNRQFHEIWKNWSQEERNQWDKEWKEKRQRLARESKNAAQALLLAEAKKPCPACLGEDGYEECVECKGTGEVYILPDEVRPKCDYCHGNGTRLILNPIKTVPCSTCKGRGWTPLDPEKLGRWMAALVEAGCHSLGMEFYPPLLNDKWTLAWGLPPRDQADTPEEVFFAAAIRHLGLESKETE